MKKLVITLFVVGLLVGCTKSTSEISTDYVLPPELSQCKVYFLDNGGLHPMRVLYCPNASTATTYMNGKVTEHTAMIDGIGVARDTVYLRDTIVMGDTAGFASVS